MLTFPLTAQTFSRVLSPKKDIPTGKAREQLLSSVDKEWSAREWTLAFATIGLYWVYQHVNNAAKVEKVLVAKKLLFEIYLGGNNLNKVEMRDGHQFISVPLDSENPNDTLTVEEMDGKKLRFTYKGGQIDLDNVDLDEWMASELNLLQTDESLKSLYVERGVIAVADMAGYRLNVDKPELGGAQLLLKTARELKSVVQATKGSDNVVKDGVKQFAEATGEILHGTGTLVANVAESALGAGKTVGRFVGDSTSDAKHILVTSRKEAAHLVSNVSDQARDGMKDATDGIKKSAEQVSQFLHSAKSKVSKKTKKPVSTEMSQSNSTVSRGNASVSISHSHRDQKQPLLATDGQDAGSSSGEENF